MKNIIKDILIRPEPSADPLIDFGDSYVGQGHYSTWHDIKWMLLGVGGFLALIVPLSTRFI